MRLFLLVTILGCSMALVGCGSAKTEFTAEAKAALDAIKTIGARVNGDPDNLNITCTGLAGIKDEHMKGLGTIPDIISLRLDGTSVTDEGVAALKDLKNIQILYLNEKVTDKIMAQIGTYTQLKTLEIDGAKGITDKGGVELGKLKGLKTLKLANTKVGDATVKAVAEAGSVIMFDLGYTEVNDAGIKALEDLDQMAEVILFSVPASMDVQKALRDKLKDTSVWIGQEGVDPATLGDEDANKEGNKSEENNKEDKKK